MFDMHGETVCYNEKDETAVIIDQTLLPGEIVIKELKEKEEMFDAIKRLEVRGAPAIGVFAAIGLSVLTARDKAPDEETVLGHFLENLEYLTSSRPTAVNLFAAADEMKKTALLHKGEGADSIRAALKEKALELHDKDIEVCRKIGEHGARLLEKCDSILTHCNAGRLATVKYGTALAPVYVAAENGHKIRVFSDETRPLLQGARLTSFELANAGIDTTLICDNAASYVMKNGLVSAVLVGCDRVAANGDTANKIGTSGVAVLAKYYGIPFYVCAPFSTIDKNCLSGKDIKIEMRSGDEITDMWYEKRMAPKNIGTLNPAFDVTDNSLITAFITEKGVLTPSEF
ncbi:MAG TPA: S-methyl-5-thioribose-1-phosphate isomerase [Ruminococcaceae bacterium]|nr:S-methyl-5-thioribose-1-phosphate isomerase [Oscillospiraceae bacterium]